MSGLIFLSSSEACPGPEFPLPLYQQNIFIFLYGLVAVAALAANAVVVYMMRFKETRTTKSCFLVNFALANILIAVLCSPFTFVPTLILASYPFGWFIYVYGMVLLTIQCLLPVGILTFTYSAIIIHAKRLENDASAIMDSEQLKRIKKANKKFICDVEFYIAAWFPLNVYNIVSDQFLRPSCYSYIHYVWFACHWLAMSHSAFNPFIYFKMHSQFRSGFIYVLNCIFCCRRKPNEWLVERKLMIDYTTSPFIRGANSEECALELTGSASTRNRDPSCADHLVSATA
ncbi:putative Neuropeptide Y receptor [Hypsibius exemplaris]|uniref:Neuropeptide Y receptor n=1 Tax=Hypsibius exemplaris TaxID=2072580 RepID=A0A1W0WKH0_HYPEX|nr:putative Neuropeptide Y receptor [Hypsibius exemplaris]